METLQPILTILLHRAELLVPLLAVAFFVGEPIARFCGIDWLYASTDHAAAFLARKLDRTKRNIATRLYRGIVALLMLLVPALILGALLARDEEWAHIVSGFLLVALFGRAFASIRLLRDWRAAKQHTLPLELPGRDYLFADSHAVLRFLILDSGESFASGIVGVAFWYLLLGLPAVMGYSVLALLTRRTRERDIFGWSARALFQLVDVAPRALTILVLTLGAIFIPGAKPFAVFKARSYSAVLAYLLNVSLGGKMPDGDYAWVGKGSPKLQPNDLGRFLLLRVAATVLLLMAFAAVNIVNMLNHIN